MPKFLVIDAEMEARIAALSMMADRATRVTEYVDTGNLEHTLQTALRAIYAGDPDFVFEDIAEAHSFRLIVKEGKAGAGSYRIRVQKERA